MSGVDPNFLWQVVAVLMVGLTGWKLVMDIQSRKQAQEREVSFKTVFATKEELNAVKQELREFRDGVARGFETVRLEMREDKAEILKAGEQRVVALHNRANEILEAVSELRGEVHATRRTDK